MSLSPEPVNPPPVDSAAAAPNENAPIAQVEGPESDPLAWVFGPQMADEPLDAHIGMDAAGAEVEVVADVAGEDPPAQDAPNATAGATAPGSAFILNPEEQAVYVQHMHVPSKEQPTAQQMVFSLAHFDPNHDYLVLPEDGPPRALTWWNKVAAKFRPGLAIRDINFYPILPTDHRGEPIKTRHSRWWMPDGDIIINIDQHLFRLHKRIIMPHLLRHKIRIEALRDVIDPYTADERAIPVLNLTCVHFENRADARYVTRVYAEGHNWQPGSDEETTLLVKELADFDYDEDTRRCKCTCPTPRDFSLVCQMIYSPRTFYNRGPVFFEDLERMLHLSDYYHSLRLRDCAISGLTMLFPTTLNHHRRYTRNNAVRLVPAGYAIDTLHLCVRYKVAQLLPIVLYTLSGYDHRYLIKGILDPTRNQDWELVPFDSTITVGGQQITQVSDTRRIPKPTRLLDLPSYAAEHHKTVLAENCAERLKAAEEDRPPKISMDPEFDLRDMLARILGGRSRMQSARRDILFGFLQEIPSFPDDLGNAPIGDGTNATREYKFSEGCTSVSKMDIPPLDSISCATALKALMTKMWEADSLRFTKDGSLPKPRHALRVLPLRTTGPGDPYDELADALCPSCLSKFKFKMRRGQQELWAQLPEIFGMKSWFDIEMEGRRITEKYAMGWLGRLWDDEAGAEGGPFRQDTSYLDYDL